MVWKKNVASYIVVILASILSFIALFFGTDLLPEVIRFEIVGEQLVAILGILIVVYGLIVALYTRRNQDESYKISLLLKIGVVIFMTVVGVVARIQALGTMEVNSFYDAALVSNTESIFSNFAIGEAIYIYLLKGCFLFLGNNLQLGVLLHIVLQGITIFLLTKTFARFGFLPGLFAYTSVMTLPIFINQGESYTPNNLYFVLFAFGIWLVFTYIRGLERIGREEVKLGKHIGLVFGISLYNGFLMSIELSLGLVFACFFTILWINQNSVIFSYKKRIVLLVVASIVSCGIAFLLGAFQGLNIFSDISSQFVWQELLFIGSVVAFMCILFYKSDKSEMVSGLLFLVLVSSLLIVLFGFTILSSSLLQLTIMVGLGMGLNMILEQEYEKHSFDADAPEQFDPNAAQYKHPLLADYQEDEIPNIKIVAPVPAVVPPIVQKEVDIFAQQPLKSEELNVVEATVVEKNEVEEKVIEKNEVEEKVIEKKEVQPIKFIENPLPVPKKHVKKSIDFDYEIPEDKLFFDVWVANQDDFDFKE